MQERSPAGGAAPSPGHVVSVNVSAVHTFSKEPALEIHLLEGLGVEGDAHCGTTVRHRFARRKDPTVVNLRQVHLVAVELFEDLARAGHRVNPGDLGENVTTAGLDLLALPVGTVLHVGPDARVRLTGLRTPCRLVDGFQVGLMSHLWDVSEDGTRRRRAGVMSVVESAGVIRPGDAVDVIRPDGQQRPLPPV